MRSIINLVVAASLALPSTMAAADSTSTTTTPATAAAATCPPGGKGTSNLTYTPADPSLSTNYWIGYLYPTMSPAGGMTNLSLADYLKSAPSPCGIVALSKSLNWEHTIFQSGDMPSSTQNKTRAQNDQLSQAQLDQYITLENSLIHILATAPGLAKYINAQDYMGAFTYAEANGLMFMLEQQVGLQLLGAKPFTPAQMTAFYTAAQANWDPNKLGLNPYPGVEWGDGGKLLGDAQTNLASTDGDNQYPDLGRFAGMRPPESFMKKFGTPILEAIAIAVVTYGVGSVIAVAGDAALDAAGVATTTIAADGTVTATLAGTAVNVASGALAAGAVGAAQGQNFGTAFLSGLEGGVLGQIAAPIAGKLAGGISSATDGVISGTGATFLSNLAIGTGTNAILNGGNLSSAFEGAFLSSGMGAARSLASTSPSSYDPNAVTDADPQTQLDIALARASGVTIDYADQLNQPVGGFDPNSVTPPTEPTSSTPGTVGSSSSSTLPEVTVTAEGNPAANFTVKVGATGAYQVIGTTSEGATTVVTNLSAGQLTYGQNYSVAVVDGQYVILDSSGNVVTPVDGELEITATAASTAGQGGAAAGASAGQYVNPEGGGANNENSAEAAKAAAEARIEAIVAAEPVLAKFVCTTLGFSAICSAAEKLSIATVRAQATPLSEAQAKDFMTDLLVYAGDKASGAEIELKAAQFFVSEGFVDVSAAEWSAGAIGVIWGLASVTYAGTKALIVANVTDPVAQAQDLADLDIISFPVSGLNYVLGSFVAGYNELSKNWDKPGPGSFVRPL